VPRKASAKPIPISTKPGNETTYVQKQSQSRAHMLEYHAAVKEKLVDQEVDLSRLPRIAVEGMRS
jgi:hypothetical protein